jgi:ankyrin repeat protein
VAALLARGGDPSLRAFDGLTPLIAAARLGPTRRQEKLAILEMLLERAASGGGAGALDLQAMDWHGRTALWWAAAGGCAAAVKLLLAAGADPRLAEKENGLTPLQVASCGDHADCVKLLEVGVGLRRARAAVGGREGVCRVHP